MARDDYINEMVKKANDLVDNFTWEKNCELWEMAYDWNANHLENEEIFMCEIHKEDGYEGDGFMIEDDYWLFKD